MIQSKKYSVEGEEFSVFQTVPHHTFSLPDGRIVELRYQECILPGYETFDVHVNDAYADLWVYRNYDETGGHWELHDVDGGKGIREVDPVTAVIRFAKAGGL